MYANQNIPYESQPNLTSTSMWRENKIEAMANEFQSNGNDRRELSDIGWEFRENKMGRNTNPHATEKKIADST
jgi:hypothetical protein|tara:strand:+ start:4255 stop:4473 length:219 start_codon:yes stop_codon:yes gene_type:complete